jgi:hypothetical protein
MLPMAAFLAAIFGVIIVGLLCAHPAAVVGTAEPVRISEAVVVILILKAFSAGCSALTGIEAITNGVPAFRPPRVRRAQLPGRRARTRPRTAPAPPAAGQEPGDRAVFRADWDRWNPGVRLETLDSPHRSLVHPIVDYVRQARQDGRQVAILIIEVQPRRWRYRILQNQRGLLLATVLRASTDVVICTVPYRLTTR